MIFNFVIKGDTPNSQHQVQADSLKEAIQKLQEQHGKEVEIMGWRRLD